MTFKLPLRNSLKTTKIECHDEERAQEELTWCIWCCFFYDALNVFLFEGIKGGWRHMRTGLSLTRRAASLWTFVMNCILQP